MSYVIIGRKPVHSGYPLNIKFTVYYNGLGDMPRVKTVYIDYVKVRNCASMPSTTTRPVREYIPNTYGNLATETPDFANVPSKDSHDISIENLPFHRHSSVSLPPTQVNNVSSTIRTSLRTPSIFIKF